MKDLMISLVFAIIIYCIYLVIVFIRKKGLSKFMKSTEVTYILEKYKIKLSLIDNRKFAYDLILANTVILFIILYLIGYIENLYLQILFGFALALPLVYLVYNLLGDKYKELAEAKEIELEKKETVKETKKVKKTVTETTKKKSTNTTKKEVGKPSSKRK